MTIKRNENGKRIPPEGGKNTKFTSETGRVAAISSTAARKSRMEWRNRAYVAAKDKLYDYWVIAINTQDEELLDFVIKAARFVGLEFVQSPEFVQKYEVTAETEAKVDGKIEFVLPSAVTK